MPLPDDEPASRPRWKVVGKWALIALGFHLLCAAELAAVATVIYYSPENRARRQESERFSEKLRAESEAREIVQKAVKRSLRSPTTAHFDYALVRLSQKDTDVYVVSGEVHAQNGFGATIRNYYSGKARRHSDGWVLVGEPVVSNNFSDTLESR